MLMQVLSLTPDQINALPATERDAIQQLVSGHINVNFQFLTLDNHSATNLWAASQPSKRKFFYVCNDYD